MINVMVYFFKLCLKMQYCAWAQGNHQPAGEHKKDCSCYDGRKRRFYTAEAQGPREATATLDWIESTPEDE